MLGFWPAERAPGALAARVITTADSHAQVGPDVDELARGQHAPAVLTVELLDATTTDGARVQRW